MPYFCCVFIPPYSTYKKLKVECVLISLFCNLSASTNHCTPWLMCGCSMSINVEIYLSPINMILFHKMLKVQIHCFLAFKRKTFNKKSLTFQGRPPKIQSSNNVYERKHADEFSSTFNWKTTERAFENPQHFSPIKRGCYS